MGLVRLVRNSRIVRIARWLVVMGMLLTATACVPALPAECGEVCTLLALNTDAAASDDGSIITPTGAFTVSGGTLTVAETGTSAFFSVRLNQAPTANVTVPVSSGDATEISVGSASLTFTTTNWNNNQSVLVTGLDDAAVDSNQTVSAVLGAATSADANYGGQDPADVSVIVLDDESPNVIITETGLSTVTTEGGATDTYTIVLTQAPTANVTVTVNPDAQVSANASVLPVALNFLQGACPGPGTWCTAQTVTVAAVDDAVAEGPRGYTFTHVAASADGNYSGIGIINVNPAVIDNDKFTFRTAATHNGDFDNDATLSGDGDGSGIAEADAFCMADANRPNTSTYKALLADPTPAPERTASVTANAGDGQVDWVLAPNLNYFRQDGTTPLFTTNANGIFVFGAMTNSFAAAAGNHWSALRNDWRTLGGLNCSGWSSSGGNARVGDSFATDGTALQVGGPPTSCATALHLICVEQ
ncbi:MAG: DUF1554 domain-containing protein [bacterium]|nr:DUF1554 domain-containing protein [bacterium]